MFMWIPLQINTCALVFQVNKSKFCSQGEWGLGFFHIVVVAIACGLPDSGTGILNGLCYCYPHAIAHPEAKRNQIAKEVRDVLISVLVGNDKRG